jgi:hypothetical protein
MQDFFDRKNRRVPCGFFAHFKEINFESLRVSVLLPSNVQSPFDPNLTLQSLQLMLLPQPTLAL